MEIAETTIKSVYIITPSVFTDERGKFVKTFNSENLEKVGIQMPVKEAFYSVSKKDVIRGMHFQTPPMDHAKLVSCPSGVILDVVVDIRKDSPTYGKFVSVELTPENGKAIYIPSGCAHGFLSLKENSVTAYLQSTVRSEKHEGGLRFDSFGMDWKVSSPITSARDLSFPTLADFVSTFPYPSL